MSPQGQSKSTAPLQSLLLSLPLEIRLRIYMYALCSVMLHVHVCGHPSLEHIVPRARAFRLLSPDHSKHSSVGVIHTCINEHDDIFQRGLWPKDIISLSSTCQTIKSEMKSVLFQYSQLSIRIQDLPEIVGFLRAQGVHRPKHIFIYGLFQTTTPRSVENPPAYNTPEAKVRQLVLREYPTIKRITLQFNIISPRWSSWQNFGISFVEHELYDLQSMSLFEQKGEKWYAVRLGARVNVAQMTFDIKRGDFKS
ncbi:unnamed protein product [Periconia digitata]|uniref:DUF7730 domain-containing protein n=1 Tax=Periconia digitata TaxID=1303443 RepID=A0A9W4XNK5_9PLEO|nr:unnamed protein product [Periconia digitata]